jgi:sugar phosphate isomerase/epimerase
MGFGHTDASAVMAALREIGYDGYLSAEILPLPDPETAARQTIAAIRKLLDS